MLSLCLELKCLFNAEQVTALFKLSLISHSPPVNGLDNVIGRTRGKVLSSNERVEELCVGEIEYKALRHDKYRKNRRESWLEQLPTCEMKFIYNQGKDHWVKLT